MTPSTSAAPVPGVAAGRELTAVEERQLRRSRRSWSWLMLGAAAVLGPLAVAAGIGTARPVATVLHPAVPLVAPELVSPSLLVPEYVPMGDDSQLRIEGAAGVTGANAASRARGFEVELDAAIASLERAKAARKLEAAREVRLRELRRERHHRSRRWVQIHAEPLQPPLWDDP